MPRLEILAAASVSLTSRHTNPLLMDVLKVGVVCYGEAGLDRP